jgi:hypothetical protein
MFSHIKSDWWLLFHLLKIINIVIPQFIKVNIIIMANENEDVGVEEIDELPEVEEGQDDTTDYKAEAQKYQGIAKRYQTKLKKMSERPAEKQEEQTPEPKPKSDELDYGQKAFLVANDIKAQDEIKLVQAVMKDTGKSLEQVLESKYFQAEIKEMREKKQTDDATPSKSNRSNNSAKNDVDYWIAKGELPDDVELRRKVVNARIDRDSKKNPFATK